MQTEPDFLKAEPLGTRFPGTGFARKPHLAAWGWAVLISAAVGLGTGCATSPAPDRALVCPQCKVVMIDKPRPAGDPDALLFESEPMEKHTCPGCQGALTRLLREGVWQHHCSFCDTSPYTCPISHGS